MGPAVPHDDILGTASCRVHQHQLLALNAPCVRLPRSRLAPPGRTAPQIVGCTPCPIAPGRDVVMRDPDAERSARLSPISRAWQSMRDPSAPSISMGQALKYSTSILMFHRAGFACHADLRSSSTRAERRTYIATAPSVQ
jgi:hypothetical protein